MGLEGAAKRWGVSELADKTPFTVHGVIVTAITGMNLLLGVTALLAVTLGAPEFAAWSLLTCVALDAADGFLARHWSVSSAFGAQLDSLADMTSFIVASAVLAFYWFSPEAPLAWVVVAGSMYVLSGAFRLARYNVDGIVDNQFEGMPTTAVAALVSLTYLTYPQLDCLWGVGLMALLAILMVSVFPYPKAARMIKYPKWFFALLAVGAAISVSWTIWLANVAYIVSGPFNWARRRWVQAAEISPVASDLR